MSIRQNILGLYRSYSHSILNLQISQVAGIVGNLIFTMVIVRIIDILGRDASDKGFNIVLYDDGSVLKKYIIE